MKLQAFRPSNPKSLQSQTSLRSKNRLPLNGLEGCSRPTIQSSRTAETVADQKQAVSAGILDAYF
jgi:hypothetical protein